MSVVFVRRWFVAFLIAIGIFLIVALSLRKVSFLILTYVLLSVPFTSIFWQRLVTFRI